MTKLGHCSLCGINMDMPGIGTHHRCVPRPPATPDVANKPAGETAVANGMANAEHLANDNGSANVPGRNRASTTYRYRNPDKRRAYQRDLMRQRRASGRAA